MIVNHPTLPGVRRDVPAEAVQDWVASGWIADEPVPTPTAVTDEPEVTPEAAAPARPSTSRKKV